MDREKSENKDQSSESDNFETVYSDRRFSDVILPHLKKILRVKKQLFYINAVVVLLAIAYLLIFGKPYFDSSVTILPDYGNRSGVQGGLSAMAAITGISLGDSNPAEVYQNLLMSESIIEPVVYTRYKTFRFADSVNLIQYYHIEPQNSLPENLRDRKMFVDINKIMTEAVITVSLEPLTKILTLTVRMPESKLSADVANGLIKSLDSYVRTKRKSNAIHQRTYLEKRVAEVRDTLSIAEEELKRFQLGNQTTSQSPTLSLTQSRLNRQVYIVQSVYGELVRQLELAKIEEIKDAPIVNIREWAKEPVDKKGPSRLRALILISFASVLISIVYFLIVDRFRSFLKRLHT